MDKTEDIKRLLSDVRFLMDDIMENALDGRMSIGFADDNERNIFNDARRVKFFLNLIEKKVDCQG